MDDLISRQAALDAIGEIHPLDYNAQAIAEKIKELPSAQPERKKGKWGTFPHHVYDDGAVLYGHACSECKRLVLYSCDEKNSYSFCPYCGADMRGSDGSDSMGVSEEEE